jgi:GMP synthase (glutamine-hydrolysing)
MRLLAIVHQSDGGPGVFAETIAASGADLDTWFLPEQAEPPADPRNYDGVLVLGGSMQVDEGERYDWLGGEIALLAELVDRRVPLLGICLGGQLLATAAGAPARRAADPEVGWFEVELTAEGGADPLLAPLAPSFEAFQWHYYEFPLPIGAVPLARTERCLQACRIGDAAWALQFHPEVSASDVQGWIRDGRDDEEALAIGLDPDALSAETAAKIGAFNELGRDICRRWLAVAS